MISNLSKRKEAVRLDTSLPWWFRVDWTLKDSLIGKQVGLTRSQVYKVRQRLKIPPCVKRSETWLKWFNILRDRGDKTDVQISQEQGVSRMYVYIWRKRIAQDIAKYKYQTWISFRRPKKLVPHRDHPAAIKRLQPHG